MNAIDREQFAALLEGARIKPRLRRELRFVPEEIFDWEDRDFLAVTNRARTKGVLIFGEFVAPFHLQARKPNQSGRIEAIICDFCATWRRGTESAVVSFQKERSSQSFLCCADLNCSLHVRGKTLAASLSRTQLRESISPQQRIVRLIIRLGDIMATL